MADISPLVDAQQRFISAAQFRATGSEFLSLEQACGRVLFCDITAPMDLPPYHRVIVEGFLVNAQDTQGASEASPLSFEIVGEVKPGDESCPPIAKGTALRVATGSIASEGPLAVVRRWEATPQGNAFSITRSFPPRFFIEEQGVDLRRGTVVAQAGSLLGAWELGLLASLGLAQVRVAHKPSVAIFSSGNEVIPHTAPLRPGAILDSNSVMLHAAVAQAGGSAYFAGIMQDDFDAFVASARLALERADMLLISGGTAVGGRDFISDLVRALGNLIVDGVPMRSGRPLIMGTATNGKPIVCVAGHPPEALRGFNLFGVAALNKLLGRELPLPEDAPAS